MYKSFFIKTYGCQMNSYDSEKVNDLLLFNGFKKAEDLEKTDVAILNTCHIREKASEKLYSDLGRLSIFKKNKEKLGKKFSIVVMGCVLTSTDVNFGTGTDFKTSPASSLLVGRLCIKSSRVDMDFFISSMLLVNTDSDAASSSATFSLSIDVKSRYVLLCFVALAMI